MAWHLNILEAVGVCVIVEKAFPRTSVDDCVQGAREGPCVVRCCAMKCTRGELFTDTMAQRIRGSVKNTQMACCKKHSNGML